MCLRGQAWKSCFDKLQRFALNVLSDSPSMLVFFYVVFFLFYAPADRGVVRFDRSFRAAGRVAEYRRRVEMCFSNSSSQMASFGSPRPFRSGHRLKTCTAVNGRQQRKCDTKPASTTGVRFLFNEQRVSPQNLI